MIRRELPARADWQSRVERAGLAYHSGGEPPAEGGGLWWHEGACWELTSAEVDALDDATAALHARCLDAVDHIVNREPALLADDFALPAWFAQTLSESWRRGDPALMGRMDLAFDDATGTAALLEYNADTLTPGDRDGRGAMVLAAGC